MLTFESDKQARPNISSGVYFGIISLLSAVISSRFAYPGEELIHQECCMTSILVSWIGDDQVAVPHPIPFLHLR